MSLSKEVGGLKELKEIKRTIRIIRNFLSSGWFWCILFAENNY